MIACAAVTIICFKEVEPVREPIVNRQPHIDLFFQVSNENWFFITLEPERDGLSGIRLLTRDLKNTRYNLL